MQVMPVPPVLLDGADRPYVSTGHTEHGLGALDRPEKAQLLVLVHKLAPCHGAAALCLVWTEHKAVLGQLSLQQFLSYGEVMGDVLRPTPGAGQEGPTH